MRQPQTTTIAFALLFIAAFGWKVTGGDLNPSAPPQPTMKTLDQVEPRIPIGQNDIPYEISKSGSYYLTENVATNETAFEILADHVTLDLCGYSISGPDRDNVHGVYMQNRVNVEIRNGTIRDFDFGIYDTGNDGRNNRVIGIRAISNLASGIRLGGDGHMVKDCTVADSGHRVAGSTVYGIYVRWGSIVTGNLIYGNGYSGSAAFYGISCGSGGTISGNAVYNNGTSASSWVIGISTGSGSTIRDNSSYSNGHSATSVVRGISTADGCSIIGNSVHDNGSPSATSAFGIYMKDSCLVDQNAAFGNEGTDLRNIPSCTYGNNVPKI